MTVEALLNKLQRELISLGVEIDECEMEYINAINREDLELAEYFENQKWMLQQEHFAIYTTILVIGKRVGG